MAARDLFGNHPYEQPWCSHPDYHVYWEHYRAMKQWYEENKQALWNSAQIASLTSARCSCQGSNWRWPTCSSVSSLSVSSSVGKPCKPKRQKLRRRRSTSRRRSRMANEAESTQDDDDNANKRDGHNDGNEHDDEDENFEMEITAEMIAFIEQSEKHKEEMRSVRKLDEENLSYSSPEKYATVSNAYTGTLQQSCLPPRERPGALRTAEMKLLYGTDAAMIHGMETAMQLAFDRNCDLLQPKLWPNIPLNLRSAESNTGI